MEKKKSKFFDVDRFMEDNRWNDMFSKKDFEIDKTSENYKLMHPSERVR